MEGVKRHLFREGCKKKLELKTVPSESFFLGLVIIVFGVLMMVLQYQVGSDVVTDYDALGVSPKLSISAGTYSTLFGIIFWYANLFNKKHLFVMLVSMAALIILNIAVISTSFLDINNPVFVPENITNFTTARLSVIGGVGIGTLLFELTAIARITERLCVLGPYEEA